MHTLDLAHLGKIGVNLIVCEATPDDALRLTKWYNQLVNNPAVNVEPEQIQAFSDDARSKLAPLLFTANNIQG